MFFKWKLPFKWSSTYHEPAHPSALIFVLATKKKIQEIKRKQNTHTNIYAANLNKLYCMVIIRSYVQAFVLYFVYI